MQRKNFLIHSLALAAALLAGSVSAQTVKLTLAHGTALDNPRHTASLKFAEVVKAKSNGRIEVTVAGAAQLGDDAAMVTALRTGALDMSANSQGAVANVVPEYAAFGMPFLFSSQAHAWRVMDGPAGQELAEKSADKGLIVLGYWDNGIRQMSNSKRPLLKPADLKGLKMRTPPDTVTVDIMQSMGAEAQQIKFSELYVALQQGVVDGQENPLSIFTAAKLHSVAQKNITLWGYVNDPLIFVVNKEIWNSWTPADREIVKQAAIDAGKEEIAIARKGVIEADKPLLKDISALGVTVTQLSPAERAAFVKATRPVYDKWKGQIGTDLVNMAEKAIAARKQ